MSDNQQVAIREEPRLLPPANLEENYGIDPDQWAVLVDATFPSAATTQGVLMALAYCKQRNLDPFRKCIHIVPMETKDRNGSKRTIETIWPGIGELRITAQRQNDFAGWDDCEFGPDIEFSGHAKVQKWVKGKPNGWENVQWKGIVPEWAQFSVYKMIHGQRIRLPGPRVYFMETYAPVGRFNHSPNERWCRAPRQMIEKCAEAAALRRGWPDVFGDEMSFEEVEGGHLRGEKTPEAQEKTASGESKQRPKREDFQAQRRPEPVEDAEFTEVKTADDQSRDPDHGRQKDEPAPSNEEEKINDQKDPTTKLPETIGQWEAWQDAFFDQLEDINTPDELDGLIDRNLAKLEAAPEDFQGTLSATVAAKRGKIAGGSSDGRGAAAGN